MLEPLFHRGSEEAVADDGARRPAHVHPPRAPQPASRGALSRGSVLALQRGAGNHQVARLLAGQVSTRTRRPTLQRVELIREPHSEKWREKRRKEPPLKDPTHFTDWLAGGRPQQTLVEADTSKLSGIEIEQMVDILARDGAVELSRRVRDEGAGTRVRADVVTKAYTEFDVRLKVLASSTAAEWTASTALKEIEALQALGKDVQLSLQRRMIVSAAADGGVEGLRDRMGPAMVIALGALERAAKALKKTVVEEQSEKKGDEAEQQSELDEAAVAPMLGQLKEGVGNITKENIDALLRWVRSFRTRKAYEPVGQREQWANAKISERLPPEQEPGLPAMATLSKRNLEALHRDVDPLLNGADGEQWTQLLKRLKGLNYRIKHATPAFYAIANAGNASSLAGLVRRGAQHKASGMSSDDNTTKLGNADFVFFRFEVGGAAMATRYGPTTMMFDPELLVKHNGWVSLHDQLSPLDRPSTREYRDPETKEQLRTTEYPKGQGFKPGQRVSWVHEYPNTKGTSPTSFLDEAFVGEDIIDGLALSILREVHRIGGGFADKLLNVSAEELPEKTNERLAELVKGLVRPEAKIPSSVATALLLEVSDPSGDGRYYRDGSVHPEGMYAAVAGDEAAAKRQQIETFEDSFNRAVKEHGATSKEAAEERAAVANRYKELLGLAQVSIERTQVFVSAAAKENSAPKDVSPEDAGEALATAKRVVPRREKLLEGWIGEAAKWDVKLSDAKRGTGATPVVDAKEAQAKKQAERERIKQAREQKKLESEKKEPSEKRDTAEAKPESPALVLTEGLPEGTEVTRAALAKAAKIGTSSGVGNLCLLNSLVAHIKHGGGGADLTGVKLRDSLISALVTSQDGNSQVAHARLTNEQPLDIHGPEGLIVLQHLMTEYGFRIQVLAGDGKTFRAHPVQGNSGPIHFILHSNAHFVPAWTKTS